MLNCCSCGFFRRANSGVRCDTLSTGVSGASPCCSHVLMLPLSVSGRQAFLCLLLVAVAFVSAALVSALISSGGHGSLFYLVRRLV